ncbi:hypothetical protein B0H13DRAFT_1926697 [Mycena leptocephala]|nr:hypothetical protein B0H13DRAFT_1926697 [Mycena leptocephala]
MGNVPAKSIQDNLCTTSSTSPVTSNARFNSETCENLCQTAISDCNCCPKNFKSPVEFSTAGAPNLGNTHPTIPVRISMRCDFETVRMPSAMSGRLSMNCFDSVVCKLRARFRNQECGNNLHLEGLVQMLASFRKKIGGFVANRATYDRDSTDQQPTKQPSPHEKKLLNRTQLIIGTGLVLPEEKYLGNEQVCRPQRTARTNCSVTLESLVQKEKIIRVPAIHVVIHEFAKCGRDKPCTETAASGVWAVRVYNRSFDQGDQRGKKRVMDPYDREKESRRGGAYWRRGTSSKQKRKEELKDGHGERKGATRQQKLERHHDSRVQCKQKSKEALAQESCARHVVPGEGAKRHMTLASVAEHFPAKQGSSPIRANAGDEMKVELGQRGRAWPCMRSKSWVTRSAPGETARRM